MDVTWKIKVFPNLWYHLQAPAEKGAWGRADAVLGFWGAESSPEVGNVYEGLRGEAGKVGSALLGN